MLNIGFRTADAIAYAFAPASILTHGVPVSTTSRTGLEHGRYARELFSVEGKRVTLQAERGWQCACTPNAEDVQCVHVEQAQAFRKLRGVRPDEDTIELQFSAAQLQELSRAAPVEQTSIALTANVAVPKPLRRHSPWTTVAVAAAMSAIASGITYFATARALHSRTAETQSFSQRPAASTTPQAAMPREVAVKFVNPFDATEIFEFSPGTSETEARDAVAEYLLSRARARQPAVEVNVHSRESAERARPTRAIRWAEADRTKG